MRRSSIVFLALLIGSPAFAQEPVGCDKFKWSIDKERATFNGTDLPKVASGDHITWPLPFAAIVALKPLSAADLPLLPEHAPKAADTFAGFLQVSAPAHAGTYRFTLSAEAWIDIVQAGHTLKSSAFSGATGCDGVRKSVKFPLAKDAFTVQLSGIAAPSIKMAIAPD